MAFTLEKVVPWGRSFDEYVSMFSLDERDLEKRILGCGDGPASFNADLTARGGRIISIDPIYNFTGEEIDSRIQETYEKVVEQTRLNRDEFVWKNFRSVEELADARMQAMKKFLADYRKGDERYTTAELPDLPFGDGEFGLALCSHFLFLYSEQLDLDFHVKGITELCRVAEEVRIFPLLEMGAVKSRHLDNTIFALRENGMECEIVKVDYEFQKSGNEMLQVKKGR